MAAPIALESKYRMLIRALLRLRSSRSGRCGLGLGYGLIAVAQSAISEPGALAAAVVPGVSWGGARGVLTGSAVLLAAIVWRTSLSLAEEGGQVVTPADSLWGV